MWSALSVFTSLAVLAPLLTPVAAVPVWGQCGGIGYSGSTVCDAGSYCQYSNDWYSQCLPGTNPTPTSTSRTSTSSTRTSTSSTRTSTSSTRTSTISSTTRTSTTSTTRSSTTSSSSTSTAPNPSGCPNRTKFLYYGMNESSAEFGNQNLPGVEGTDYTWPSPSSIDYFVGKGFNSFRIPFQLERLSPRSSGLTGSFDQAYLNGLKTIVNYITNKGAYAIIEPHNSLLYYGAAMTSEADFGTWWKNLSQIFISNTRVIFDIMNEPHDIPASKAFSMNQAAVNAIRAGGATQQLILVEGTAWTGAWSWVSSGNGAAFQAISDPNNNIAIEMHQYLDSDSSGTSATCVSSTIGVERLQAATAWLQQNNLKGFLGEMGAGSNSVCIEAVKSAICHLQQAGGTWIGFTWWAAGPWWGNYFQSMEPPNGAAIPSMLPQALLPYL